MYLVTGGCGFIGSHLVELLLEKGYRVRVLDDLSNSLKKNLPQGAEFIQGSIADEAPLRLALKKVDGVFHLAAMVSVIESMTYWHKTHCINCGGTVRLLELAKGIPIVFASSAAVYGDSGQLPHRESVIPKPLSPYAVDKLASEMHAQIAWDLNQTPSIACRFFNVYGPRQNPTSPYSGVISKFTYNILRNEPITVFGDGQQIRDFIYVKDVVQMLLYAMEMNKGGARVYNFCTGRECTINALADLIGNSAGLTFKKEYAAARPGDMRVSLGDPSKASSELNIRAEIPLEEGLKKYLLNLMNKDKTLSPAGLTKKIL